MKRNLVAGDGAMDTVLEVTFVSKLMAGVQVVRMEGGFIDKHTHDHTHALAAEKVQRLQQGERFHRTVIKSLEAKFTKD